MSTNYFAARQNLFRRLSTENFFESSKKPLAEAIFNGLNHGKIESIIGLSCSGKTTLKNAVVGLLGERNILHDEIINIGFGFSFPNEANAKMREAIDAGKIVIIDEVMLQINARKQDFLDFIRTAHNQGVGVLLVILRIKSTIPMIADLVELLPHLELHTLSLHRNEKEVRETFTELFDKTGIEFSESFMRRLIELDLSSPVLMYRIINDLFFIHPTPNPPKVPFEIFLQNRKSKVKIDVDPLEVIKRSLDFWKESTDYFLSHRDAFFPSFLGSHLWGVNDRIDISPYIRLIAGLDENEKKALGDIANNNSLKGKESDIISLLDLGVIKRNEQGCFILPYIVREFVVNGYHELSLIHGAPR
ncbi:MAG: hypothetical protein WC501_03820 [Candidatus Micrarchaeia archaeon]